jgi:hypothetical protein
MALGTVIGIIFIAIIGIWYYFNTKSKDPINFNTLAEENVEFLFKSLSAVGTFIEVMNLSLVAMDSMGMDLFQAFSRYALIGVIEILTSFIFISVVSNSMRRAAEKNKLNFLELLKVLLKSIPVFFVGFVITGIIYLLYLESIFHLEAQQNNTQLWWLPILGFTLEFNPNNYKLIDPDWRQPISFASVFLIYTTTIFDIMLIYFLHRKYTNEVGNKSYVKKDVKDNKDSKDKGKDTKEESKEAPSEKKSESEAPKKEEPNPTKFTIYEAIDQLETLFKWNASDIKARLNKVLGEDLSDKTMIHPDISNGTKTKDQIKTIMENLIVGQIGDSPSGVLGFTDLNRQISIKEKEVQKVTSPLAEFEKKLKGGIWEDISDSYNDAKLKREKKELEDKMKPLEETRDALRMELKALTDKKNQLKESLETRLKRSNLLK